MVSADCCEDVTRECLKNACRHGHHRDPQQLRHALPARQLRPGPDGLARLDIEVEIPELDHHTPYELMAALSRAVTPTVAMVVNQFGQESRFPRDVVDNILVDFRFAHAGVEWKLDMILLAERGEWIASVYDNPIKQHLTPEARRIIANIKQKAVR